MILLVTSWIKELHDEREPWENDPFICSMVSEAYNIFHDATQSILKLSQVEVEAQRRHEELFAEKVALKEEQMRLSIIRLQELVARTASCVLVQPCHEPTNVQGI